MVKPKTVGVRLGIIVLAAFTCAALFAREPAATKWRTLDGCRYTPNQWNDGDSFHVEHDGKQFIFRLYFVDSPETTAAGVLADRVKGQAKAFGITEAETLAIGKRAAKIVQEKLTGKPLKIVTRLQSARGRSKLPRHFAFVEVDGRDLAEFLIAEGLARVYGAMADHPNGTSAKRIRERLKELENQARREHRGAWALVGPLK